MLKLFKKARRACLFAAAGAAGAYLLDPERGAARRAKTKERFQSVRGQAGSQASKVTQQVQTVRSQTTPQAHEPKVTVSDPAASSGSLDESGDAAGSGHQSKVTSSDEDGDVPPGRSHSDPLTKSVVNLPEQQPEQQAEQQSEPSLADDGRLADAVRERLAAAGISAEDVAVDAADGVVALRGRVSEPERAAKIADEARTVDGVKDVRSFLHGPDQHQPVESTSTMETSVLAP
ncbi:MAG: BON domain-containing protein [Actinomycetota bacterium]|nr:BON domain-containing protein [Actinomycetota bacterium]